MSSLRRFSFFYVYLIRLIEVFVLNRVHRGGLDAAKKVALGPNPGSSTAVTGEEGVVLLTRRVLVAVAPVVPRPILIGVGHTDIITGFTNSRYNVLVTVENF